MELLIIAICVLLVIALLLSGAPFYVAFAAFAIPFLILYAEVPGEVLGETAANSVASFTLIALPLFILLGGIMARTGATRDLFNLARSFFGHIRGGMGITAIVAAAGFGAMCGSGLATALAISTIAVPELVRFGYKRSTIAAICGSAGGLGLLIPPSLAFIILGPILEVSVGDLFMAGIVPGVLMAIFLSLACYVTCRNNQEIQRDRRYTWNERLKAFVKALPAFTIPLAILVSIYFGIATPTESAGVACIVALLLGFFYYRSLNLQVMKEILKDTARSTSAVWFIIMGAIVFGRVLAYENVPQFGARFVSDLGLSYIGFIAAIMVLFFILGMFFDAFILTLAALPPLLMALKQYDVPLVWFGIVFQIMVIIGQITPPVGITLYASAAGAEADVGDTIREVIPYLIALLMALAVLIMFPMLVIY